MSDLVEIGPGDLLLRKYRLQHVVGKGGSSVVFAARHEQLGTTVAIKVLKGSDGDPDEDAARRFLREARAAAALRNPYVTQVLDVDIDELGRHCLVMELLEGRDLSRVVREESPLPVERAVGLVCQACAGMEVAHAAGILHRDLKPQNLFLTSGPQGAPLVKILDFGVSKIVDSGLWLTASSTSDVGMLMGTPLYMSPERLRFPNSAEPAADVWALGAILFELLTGTRPFPAATLPELIAVLLSDDRAPFVTSLRADVPQGLGQVIEACLQKDASARMPSMRQLREALRPWTPDWARAPAPVAAPPGETRSAARPTPSRWKAAAVGALVVGAAAGLLVFGNRARRAPPSAPTALAGGGPAQAASLSPPRAEAPLVLPVEPAPSPSPPPPAVGKPRRPVSARAVTGHGDARRRTKISDPLEGRE